MIQTLWITNKLMEKAYKQQTYYKLEKKLKFSYCYSFEPFDCTWDVDILTVTIWFWYLSKQHLCDIGLLLPHSMKLMPH